MSMKFIEVISKLTPKSSGVGCGVSVFIVISLCVLFMGQLFHKDQYRFLKEELIGLAIAAAESIDADAHNSIRKSVQIDSSEYSKAIAPLVLFHNAFPRITYLYTMIEISGDAFFILDTAADPRLKSKKKLKPSSVMSKYKIDAKKQARWLETLRSGNVYVDPELVTDEYGTFISASAPFYDSQRRYAGFVGVDYDVKLFLERRQNIITALFLTLFIGLFFSVGIGVFVWRLKRSRDVNVIRRERAEIELEETSSLLETAMSSIDQGFLVWDNEHRVIVCNQRYHDLWGYPNELLKAGAPLIELMRYRAETGAYGSGDPEKLAQQEMVGFLKNRDNSVGFMSTVDGRTLFSKSFKIENNKYLSICSDFTKLSQAQKELEEREAQLMAIFNNTPVCLNLKDAEGRYLLVNKPYEDWLELSADQIIGKKFREFTNSEDSIYKVEKNENEMFRTGKAVESTIKFKRPDGQEYDRLLIKFPVKTNDGKINGFGSVALDISEMKRKELDLSIAKDQAIQANLSKSTFLATMSHELRTPLNAILGFSSMIESQILGPDNMETYSQYAADINSSGLRLLRLINDLLDLSKIEAGKHELELQQVSADDVISDCLQIVAPLSAEKNIQIIYQSAPSHLIRADRQALDQIFLNILSNAIKFSPESSSITIFIQRDEVNTWISFSDTGVGIKQDDISKVVKPWEQLKDSSIAGEHGSGLGLPIVNALVGMHGGGLNIESEIGKGTCVTVTLPIDGPSDLI